MTTVLHNSTTPSVSVTAASGNDQPQLVATIVPDEQRISFWPQHFGLIPQWVALEPRVFGWMDRLCEDYCGGIWNLYTLNNGGAFMAPEPDDDDDETWVLFNAMNGITVTRNSPTGQAMTTDAEAAVSEALRDLAFWLYRQLENEYDWLTSDAAVDEALLINEYTFTEAGLRAGCPVIVKLSFTDFL
ncbi:antirestriction protein [Escherichia coli]|nr:antirestriction protein [Escherichia coli]MCK3230056.1 antirestriction protein [Escherichia coli]MDE1101570.1 antirestriction protein [Escherichia coli]WMX85973.1 antirestriction protein [Escherichia coli]